MALKALFVIALTTSRMIFPGIPAVFPTPDGAKAPEVSPAVRSVTMQLLSVNTAAKPEAGVMLPAGLQLAETARMQVTPARPLSGQVEGSSKIALKTYWGSSEAVQAGQPSVKEFDNVGCAPQAADKQDYKTIAIWPGRGAGNETGPIGDSSSAAGTYKLTTNYTGETSITLGPEQDFLAPIRLAGLGDNVDLDKPIKVQWSTVPNALAYWVVAYGGNERETITWTAGSEAGAALNVDNTALTREEIGKLIEQKTLLPADATSATIPAKIFKGSTGVMLSVTAIGVDKVQQQDGIETRVIVRSTAGVPLYSSGYGK
ncbi:MAG: hypothetical protein ACYC64_06160 [Armatimonadota bacterium]